MLKEHPICRKRIVEWIKDPYTKLEDIAMGICLLNNPECRFVGKGIFDHPERELHKHTIYSKTLQKQAKKMLLEIENNKKLKVGRDKGVVDLDEAIKRVKFCLDGLEEKGFTKKFSWNTDISEDVTLEEIIGALVWSEQTLTAYREEERRKEFREEYEE